MAMHSILHLLLFLLGLIELRGQCLNFQFLLIDGSLSLFETLVNLL